LSAAATSGSIRDLHHDLVQEAAMSTEITRIAVGGAGTMGLGIAQVAALSGLETVLYDVAPSQLERAGQTIERNLQRGIEKGKVTSAGRDAALERLSTTTDLTQACRGAGMLIEAVPEQLELKVEFYGQAEPRLSATAVIATNTSALSITELAASLADPGRMVGMHFFNPVHLMRLIEIVRGLQTRDATVEAALAVARRMGKTTVEVNEAPGFVTSRINALIGNEAFFMLQEGVASARDIDTALKLGLNHPMGPFELVDLVGLDTRLSILRFLHRTLGEKYRPCPLLEKYVQAGRLGRKVGRGVFEYESSS
jgi:3-hydroxybutyryl-CoA dehydrogenase